MSKFKQIGLSFGEYVNSFRKAAKNSSSEVIMGRYFSLSPDVSWTDFDIERSAKSYEGSKITTRYLDGHFPRATFVGDIKPKEQSWLDAVNIPQKRDFSNIVGGEQDLLIHNIITQIKFLFNEQKPEINHKILTISIILRSDASNKKMEVESILSGDVIENNLAEDICKILENKDKLSELSQAIDRMIKQQENVKVSGISF